MYEHFIFHIKDLIETGFFLGGRGEKAYSSVYFGISDVGRAGETDRDGDSSSFRDVLKVVNDEKTADPTDPAVWTPRDDEDSGIQLDRTLVIYPVWARA